MVYRTLIDGRRLLLEYQRNAQTDASPSEPEQVLLHFGAVDWATDVYVNGLWIGSHEGGYDAFFFEISDALGQGAGELDELMVVVHDPSNYGSQPFGKQRTSAMWRPAGDTYTTNSGIWQSVWLETVPAVRIESLKLAPNSTHLILNARTTIPATGGQITATVIKDGAAVVESSGQPNVPFAIEIPSPEQWSPENPFLYNLSVSYGTDHVGSYFGMRDVTVGSDSAGNVRPCFSGTYRFLTGVLDQNFWSDGVYLAPGDAAMVYDLHAIKMFGHNFVRLHQVTPFDL
jgi:beta-galactosidase/beta-glucuronidase